MRAKCPAGLFGLRTAVQARRAARLACESVQAGQNLRLHGQLAQGSQRFPGTLVQPKLLLFVANKLPSVRPDERLPRLARLRRDDLLQRKKRLLTQTGVMVMYAGWPGHRFLVPGQLFETKRYRAFLFRVSQLAWIKSTASLSAWRLMP